MRNENKEYFRGLLQFIVITVDASKKISTGSLDSHGDFLTGNFSGHIKESDKCSLRNGLLIVSLIRQRKLNICPRWGPVWIWPMSGCRYGTGLDCCMAVFICFAPLRLLSLHVYTEAELLWGEDSGEQAELFTCKPAQLTNVTHLVLEFRVSWRKTVMTLLTIRITMNDKQTHIYKSTFVYKTIL